MPYLPYSANAQSNWSSMEWNIRGRMKWSKWMKWSKRMKWSNKSYSSTAKTQDTIILTVQPRRSSPLFFIHIHLYTFISIYVYTHLSIYIPLYMYIHIYLYTHIYVYIHPSIYRYFCVYTSIYIHTSMYIHLRIHIYNVISVFTHLFIYTHLCTYIYLYYVYTSIYTQYMHIYYVCLHMKRGGLVQIWCRNSRSNIISHRPTYNTYSAILVSRSCWVVTY